MPSRRRQSILQAVREHPGAHLRELEAITGSGVGGLRHHLDRLERQGFIRHEFDLRFKRFFPAAVPPNLARILAALRQTPLRRVVACLLDSPRQRLSELASRLQIPRSSMSAYLRRLQKLRVLDVDAGAWTVVDETAVRQGMAAWKPGPLDRLIDSPLALMEEQERGQRKPDAPTDTREP